MGGKKARVPDNRIVHNRKARHDYFLGERMEAGLSLQGWEVKALRAGRVQLVDSYVLLKNGEAFLLGALITPLDGASMHPPPDPRRTRKLLLKRAELARLHGAVARRGHTALCTSLHWRGHLVKAEVCLGRGKAAHDKRDTDKERDWQRQKERLLRRPRP